MIKVEKTEVWGFEHAIRGMRNPMNSWAKSDSKFYPYDLQNPVVIGENDLDLMRRLNSGGQPHRKYLRQIMVSMDITAPLYWWKEFDTYKVGTVANSCSTMHKVHAKEFELDDFSHEHLSEGEYGNIELLKSIITCLNVARDWFIKTKDKEFWWQMIQLLPTSYNQKRTVTFTYENVMNMLDYREGHKLDEWRELCEILKALPYVKEIRNEQSGKTQS